MQDPTCFCIVFYTHSQTHTKETAKTEGIFAVYDFLLHLNIERYYHKQINPQQKRKDASVELPPAWQTRWMKLFLQTGGGSSVLLPSNENGRCVYSYQLRTLSRGYPTL